MESTEWLLMEACAWFRMEKRCQIHQVKSDVGTMVWVEPCREWCEGPKDGDFDATQGKTNDWMLAERQGSVNAVEHPENQMVAVRCRASFLVMAKNRKNQECAEGRKAIDECLGGLRVNQQRAVGRPERKIIRWGAERKENVRSSVGFGYRLQQRLGEKNVESTAVNSTVSYGSRALRR